MIQLKNINIILKILQLKSFKKLLKFLLITLIIFLFPSKSSAALKIKYFINASLDDKLHRIEAYQEVVIFNDTKYSIENLEFILFPNFFKEKNPFIHPIIIEKAYHKKFFPSSIEISKVYIENQEVDFYLKDTPNFTQNFSFENTTLLINLLKPLMPQEKLQVKIFFSLKFPHRYEFVNWQDIFSGFYFNGTYIWYAGWHPCLKYFKEGRWQNIFSLEIGDYKINIKTPKNFIVANTAKDGFFKKSYATEGNLYVLESQNIRLLPLAISKNWKVLKKIHKGINIYVYYLDVTGHLKTAKYISSIIPDIIDYYCLKFDVFPTKQITIIDAPLFEKNLIAADTAVFCSFKYKNLFLLKPFITRNIEYVIAHEIAHFYFGTTISCDYKKDLSLIEGLAQFLSVCYFENKYSRKNNFFPPNSSFYNKLIYFFFKETNLRNLLFYPYYEMNKEKEQEELIKEISETKYSNRNFARIYCKSYFMLAHMQFLLKDKMWELLKEFYKKYKYKIISAEDFERFFVDYLPPGFFKDWLHSPSKYIDLKIKKIDIKKQKDEFLTTLKVEEKGSIDTPFEVKLLTKTEQITKECKNPQEKIQFVSKQKPQKLVIDHDNKLPDINRLNNTNIKDIKFVWYRNSLSIPIDSYFLRLEYPIGLSGGYLNQWYIFLKYTGRDFEIGYFKRFPKINLTAEYLFDKSSFKTKMDFLGYSHQTLGNPYRNRLCILKFSPELEDFRYVNLFWTLDLYMKYCLELKFKTKFSLKEQNKPQFSVFLDKEFKTFIPQLVLKLVNESDLSSLSSSTKIFLIYPLMRKKEINILNLFLIENLFLNLEHDFSIKDKKIGLFVDISAGIFKTKLNLVLIKFK